MINIFKIFFSDIPDIVFEPVCIFGWAGLLVALFLWRKQHSAFYLTVIFSLAFMIIWRSAIQIISSRYAAILIIPMIIAAAFFLFQLKNILIFIPKIPQKLIQYLPLCLVVILTVICIVKNLNYKSYTPIIDAARIVRNDPHPGKRVIYTMSRSTQIEYYTKEKVYMPLTDLENGSNDLTPELCLEIIKQEAANSTSTIYIFSTATAKSPVITAGDLGIKNDSWKLLTTQYFNRKKKKVLRVYKYISESQL